MDFVQVIPSPSFLGVLKELSELSDAPSSIKKCKKTKAEDSKQICLLTQDVKWCHNKIKERGIKHRIHKLLSESEIVLPKYEPPPRSPELEERIQKLKAEQSNKEYRRMTKNIGVNQYEAASLRGLGTDIKEFKVQLREMNRYLVTGAQFLTSIIGTFFAIFIGLSFVLHDFGVRILFATFCAVVVALAEIYFIIRQDIEEENVRQKKLS